MYSIYNYKSNSTVSNILNDIVAILTGETVVANLSASCDKATTTITSVIPAGWALHDGSAGSNAKVIKAPLADDPAAFKYVEINTNATYQILTKVFETYNAATHTGTNLCVTSDDTFYSQQISPTLAGRLHVFSSARFLMLGSLIEGVWGSSSNAGLSGCFERTRQGAWDTVAAGWPPFLFCNLGYLATATDGSCAYAPRYMNRTRQELTGYSAPLYGYTGPFDSNGTIFTVANMFTNISGPYQQAPGPNDIRYTPFFPISFLNNSAMPVPYGEISSLCDIWALPQGMASSTDVIRKGDFEFICVQSGASTKPFAVRKG